MERKRMEENLLNLQTDFYHLLQWIISQNWLEEQETLFTNSSILLNPLFFDRIFKILHPSTGGNQLESNNASNLSSYIDVSDLDCIAYTLKCMTPYFLNYLSSIKQHVECVTENRREPKRLKGEDSHFKVKPSTVFDGEIRVNFSNENKRKRKRSCELGCWKYPNRYEEPQEFFSFLLLLDIENPLFPAIPNALQFIRNCWSLLVCSWGNLELKKESNKLTEIDAPLALQLIKMVETALEECNYERDIATVNSQEEDIGESDKEGKVDSIEKPQEDMEDTPYLSLMQDSTLNGRDKTMMDIQIVKEENINLFLVQMELKQRLISSEKHIFDLDAVMKKKQNEIYELKLKLNEKKEEDFEIYQQFVTNEHKRKVGDMKIKSLENEIKNYKELLEDVLGKPSESLDFTEKQNMIAQKNNEIRTLRKQIEKYEMIAFDRKMLKQKIKELEEKQIQICTENEILDSQNKKLEKKIENLQPLELTNVQLEMKIIDYEASLNGEKHRNEIAHQTILRQKEKLEHFMEYDGTKLCLEEIKDKSIDENIPSLADEIEAAGNEVRTTINGYDTQHKIKNDVVNSKRIEELEAENIRISKLKDELKQMTTEMKRDLSESKRVEEALRSELKLKEKLCDELKGKEMDLIEMHSVEANKLRSSLVDSKRAYEEMKEMYELQKLELQEKQKHLLESREALKTLQKTHSNILEKYGKLQHQFEVQKKDAEELRNDIELNWKEKLHLLEEKNATLKLEAELELGKKDTELKMTLDKSIDMKKLKDKLNNINMKLTETMRKCKALDETNAKQTKDIHRLTEANSEKELLCGRLQSEFDILSQKHKDQMMEAQEIKRSNLLLKNELNEAKNKASSEQRLVKRLQGQCIDLESELRHLLNNTSSASVGPQENLIETTSRLMENCRELEKDLEAVREERNELQRRYDSQQAQQNEIYSPDLEILKLEVTKFKRDCEKLKKELRERDWGRMEAEKRSYELKNDVRTLQEECAKRLLENRKLLGQILTLESEKDEKMCLLGDGENENIKPNKRRRSSKGVKNDINNKIEVDPKRVEEAPIEIVESTASESTPKKGEERIERVGSKIPTCRASKTSPNRIPSNGSTKSEAPSTGRRNGAKDMKLVQQFLFEKALTKPSVGTAKKSKGEQEGVDRSKKSKKEETQELIDENCVVNFKGGEQQNVDSVNGVVVQQNTKATGGQQRRRNSAKGNEQFVELDVEPGTSECTQQ